MKLAKAYGGKPPAKKKKKKAKKSGYEVNIGDTTERLFPSLLKEEEERVKKMAKVAYRNEEGALLGSMSGDAAAM